MITEQKKQTIKLIVAIILVVIVLALVGIAMIIYQVEGETNMPFKLSKIVVIGTAEGIENGEETNENKWNFSIYQNNDVYFYIDENTEKSQDLLIKNVKISNIQISKAPKKGTVKAYMPNSEAGRLYIIDDRNIVNDKLEYKGASQSSSTNLEIGSKGRNSINSF